MEIIFENTEYLINKNNTKILEYLDECYVLHEAIDINKIKKAIIAVFEYIIKKLKAIKDLILNKIKEYKTKKENKILADIINPSLKNINFIQKIDKINIPDEYPIYRLQSASTLLESNIRILEPEFMGVSYRLFTRNNNIEDFDYDTMQEKRDRRCNLKFNNTIDEISEIIKNYCKYNDKSAKQYRNVYNQINKGFYEDWFKHGLDRATSTLERYKNEMNSYKPESDDELRHIQKCLSIGEQFLMRYIKACYMIYEETQRNCRAGLLYAIREAKKS